MITKYQYDTHVRSFHNLRAFHARQRKQALWLSILSLDPRHFFRTLREQRALEQAKRTEIDRMGKALLAGEDEGAGALRPPPEKLGGLRLTEFKTREEVDAAWLAGEEIFAFDEMEEIPVRVRDQEVLGNYPPDRLASYQPDPSDPPAGPPNPMGAYGQPTGNTLSWTGLMIF